MKKKTPSRKWFRRVFTLLLICILLLLLLKQCSFNYDVATFAHYQYQQNQTTNESIKSLHRQVTVLQYQNEVLKKYIMEEKILTPVIEQSVAQVETQPEIQPQTSQSFSLATIGTVVLGGLGMLFRFATIAPVF